MIDRIRMLAALRVKGRPAVAGAAFLALLALSLVVFLVPSPGRVRRVLFYPSTTTHAAPGKPARLVAEARLLPRHRDVDRDARELVDAVLLGPAQHGEAPLFPASTAVRSLMVRRGVLYVDLSANAAIPDPIAPVPLQDAAAALSRTVRFNFPGIRQVAFTVDGQSPRPLGREKK
ncbi:MAG TPA: GerMN domain-containing protein [Desulfobacterales bacterium]|nr:GerMN domain-containing protein [Desulfobacterales bacterium]